MTQNSQSGRNRYLQFSLGTEQFALELLLVREVIAPPAITPIPQSTAQLLGIFNLRGRTIPIYDLRARLGIKPLKLPEESVIICDLGGVHLGMMVDSINSVIAPAPEALMATPQLKSQKFPDYVTGAYQSEKQLILMFDIARLFEKDHVAGLSQARAA